LGGAVFVEVPSRAFPGNSFVYLVTARHILLDDNGRPIPKLAVVLEDPQSSGIVEQPLPDEGRWIIDPGHQSADVAALPFGSSAKVAPIPLSQLFAEADQAREGLIPATVDVGAQCYYLTATALGEEKPRFVPLTRFCRVSVADAVQAQVPGAGNQSMYFIDASGAPEFRGAPVFAQAEGRYVLFGLMEPQAAGADSSLTGLIGVLPAGYIAETVEAMAEAQERKAKAAKK
jgi:hypothetical protein